MIQSLPNELLLRIFRLLGKKAKLSLSRTCSSFSLLAQTVLYEELDLSIVDPERSSDNEKIQKSYDLFSRSITERPMLADLVGTLNLRHRLSSKCPSHPILHQLSSFTNMHTLSLTRFRIDSELCETLRLLPRLRAIHFDHCGLGGTRILKEYSEKPWCSTPLDMTICCQSLEEGWTGLIPPGLRSLKLNICKRDEHLLFLDRDDEDSGKRLADLLPPTRNILHTLNLANAIPTNIIPFLVSCPELRSLSLPFSPSKFSFGALLGLVGFPIDTLPLPPDAIPRLEDFSGNAEYAEVFIKGRPVHNVTMFLGKYTPTDCLRSLALSSVPVTKLDLQVDAYNGCTIPARVLKYAPPGLRHLGFGMHEAKVLMSWIPRLSKMPNLHILEGAVVNRTDEHVHLKLAYALSSACSSLRMVIFHIDPWSVSWQEIWSRLGDGSWTSHKTWISDHSDSE